MKKNALLIIDMQNDFVLPNGALPVKGAVEDAKRLSEFIVKNVDNIHFVALTMDSHHVLDISHPGFWMDKDGNFPPPFTGLMTDFLQELKDGKWTPRFWPQKSIKYVEDLHSQGEFKHVIWPEHCLVGSDGAAIYAPVFEAIKKWERKGNFEKEIVFKGSNPLTEHYGAFRANIPIPGAIETQINNDILKTLEEYENVYFAGEAKSHCVANTLKQAMQIVPNLAKRFVILDDCMSPVEHCEHLADGIFDDAVKMGIRFAKSTDPIL